MATQVKTRIKNRIDSKQAWQQANPVLLCGEIAVETGSYGAKFKVGDGSSRYGDLPYAGNNVFIDDRILSSSGYSDLSVVRLSAPEYDELMAGGNILSNAIYVVESDFEDAHGRQMKNMAPGTDLSDAVNLEQLSDVINSISVPTDLSAFTNSPGYLVSNDISGYYKKSETSSAAEISSAFQLSAGNKVFIDNHIDNVTEQTDLSVIKLSSDEYYQLVAASAIISNAVYVVENQFKNAYGQQIKNIALPTDLSDAATKEYVDNALTNVQIPTDLSAFTNSPGYTTNVGTITGITMNGASKGTSGVVNLGTVLTAHQSLANYYTKSETSSANEISTALENAGGGSSRYALVTAQLVADGGSLTCAVDDQTITTIQVSSSSTPIIVQLPAEQQDGARDFILRIEISSSSAPTFTFSGVNETIDFDSEDDDWAIMEPGLNLVSFTETKRGDSSSSGNGGGGSSVVYHTVTFDPGSYTSLANPSDATRQVADGEAVGTLPAVTADSSVFRGWYTEQHGFGTQVMESTVITADVTFYAYIRQTSG